MKWVIRGETCRIRVNTKEVLDGKVLAMRGRHNIISVLVVRNFEFRIRFFNRNASIGTGYAYSKRKLVYLFRDFLRVLNLANLKPSRITLV